MTDVGLEKTAQLEGCLARIDENLRQIGVRLGEYQREIQEAHYSMWEARRDLDNADKVTMRQAIDQKMRSTRTRTRPSSSTTRRPNALYGGKSGDARLKMAAYRGG